MKKFLSLVLAVIMTMSLVTISAGATEYRDLTDKDEIQYEEAVAVLNRIGVITGYDDGSFRPEGELTRGAAAKIIVSLLIGPDAASNLPNATAPYPDVPSSHTFAGVISYCKTAGIISGYGDGTFKPGNSLTGFAFAKMLLGALGYKSNIEGFVDTGWTMNVAKVGNAVGLFDRLSFDGSAAVNREEACQLALNTLKATMVTYGGTTVVSGTQTLAVGSTQAVYVTSNNRDINANINRRVINAVNNEMTLEFGEEHFKDLRLEHDKYDPAYDIYGHPSNEWSYKKVTIGTFPLEADFTFTKQMAHREETVAAKEKALGLRNYDTYSTDHRAQYTNWSTASSGTQYNSPFNDATQITINGYDARVLNSNYDQTTAPSGTLEGNLFSYDASKVKEANKEEAPSLSEICDLTDNGVTVEVYVCPVDADFITNVVVTRTQLMEVDHIGSDYVSLEDIGPDSRDPRKAGDLAEITGYNDFAIDVNVQDVKDDNYDAYNVLSALKVGDRVAIIPYTADDGRTWEVGEAYVPETASGALSKVILYANTNKADGNAVGLVVGGTEYPINEWNLDVIDADGSQIKATRKDVTVYLAKDGTVLWANEIGDSDNWMVVGDYYQGTNTTTGKVAWFVHGWTIGGEEVDLDLGTIRGAAEKYAPGELVRYKIATAGTGEYELTKPNITGRSYYKNGNQSTFSEPQLYKNVSTPSGTRSYMTGEGIYEISQYARATSGDIQYRIAKGNSDLALENYAAQYITDNYVLSWRMNNAPVSGNYDNWANADTDLYRYVGIAGNKIVDKVTPTTSPYPFNYNYTSYDGVKFIFVSFDENGEVDTIDIQSGVQNVDYNDLCSYNTAWRNIGTGAGSGDLGNYVVTAAEAYVNDSGKVKAVVIKTDSSEANLSNIAVITDTRGTDQFNKGAETEIDGYTRQYRVGPNFDEELTGTFDRAYSVGDILTIRKDGDLIIGKYFHAKSYLDKNPDVLTATKIEAVKSHTGSTSKSAFKVVGYTYADGTSMGSVVPAIMTSQNILGDDDFINDIYETSREGLVTVDSSTIFIDQRVGHRDDEIDSLDDLLDRDLSSVRVKVLLNGKPNTTNFRHAYAVVVMTAPEKTDDATTPSVTITGSTLTAEKDDEGKVLYYTVKPDTTFVLTANIANDSKMGTKSYVWTSSTEGDLDNNKSTLKVVGGLAEGETVTYTVKVTNTDTTKKDKQTAVGTATIIVKGVAGATTPTGTGTVELDAGATSGATLGVVNGATIGSDSKIQIIATVNVPAYANQATASGGTKDAKFDAVVEVKQTDGKWVAAETLTNQSFSSATTDANGKTTALPISLKTTNLYPAGTEVKVTITKIDWGVVNVELVDKDTGKTIDINTAANNKIATDATTSTTDYVSTDTTNAGSAAFKSGATGTIVATNKNGTITLAGTSVVVSGDQAVVIEVDRSTLNEKYKLTAVTANLLTATKVAVSTFAPALTGADDEIQITTEPAEALTTGVKGMANVLVAITSDANNKYYSYDVEIAGINDGQPVTVVVDAGTATYVGKVDLTAANHQIKDADIKIAGTEAQAIKKATYNGTTGIMVIEFTRPLDASKVKEGSFTLGGTTPGALDRDNISVNGGTVTLNFIDKPSGTTGKVTLTATDFVDGSIAANTLGSRNEITIDQTDGNTALSVGP